jgi:hypothetical protein
LILFFFQIFQNRFDIELQLRNILLHH